MNPAIDLISGLKKVKTEDGAEQYVGSINVKSLKRTTQAEIRILLVQSEALPKGLHEMMRKGGGMPDLLMFAESGDKP